MRHRQWLPRPDLPDCLCMHAVTGLCREPLPTTNRACTPPDPPMQALTGDWRSVLTDLQRIEGLAPGEVRDACQRWLRPDNCFKGFVLPG